MPCLLLGIIVVLLQLFFQVQGFVVALTSIRQQQQQQHSNGNNNDPEKLLFKKRIRFTETSSSSAVMKWHLSSNKLNDDLNDDHETTTNENASKETIDDNKLWLAVITEPDACSSPQRQQQTLQALTQAMQTGGVDLVSVRVSIDNKPDLVLALIENLMQVVANMSIITKIVVTSDWVAAAIAGKAHGIHVKESHRDSMERIRQQFADDNLPPPWMGTSAHSVESALNAFDDVHCHPNYLFVGTCFPTQTHPEKSVDDLEGPELPGQVQRALLQQHLVGQESTTMPHVLAIGGIDATNCAIPIQLGATGVATIRAVLQASDPAHVVREMQHAMKEGYEQRHLQQEQQQQDKLPPN